MRNHLLSILCLFFIASTAYGQCYTDRHSTTWSDAWISCDPAPNPNPVRSSSHWIRYQLGAEYGLGQMHFWNYNEPNKTDQGLQEVIIDYTTDGVTWTEWGKYTIPESDGSAFYEGVAGPDLMIQATEVLITAVTNYGGPCYALSEVRIDVNEISSDEDVLDEDFAVAILPNPADAFFHFVVQLEEAAPVRYILTDLSGRKVFTQNVSLSAGEQKVQVPTADLAAGDYFLELQIGDRRSVQKLSVFHR